jgi:hypothetical protein
VNDNMPNMPKKQPLVLEPRFRVDREIEGVGFVVRGDDALSGRTDVDIAFFPYDKNDPQSRVHARKCARGFVWVPELMTMVLDKTIGMFAMMSILGKTERDVSKKFADETMDYGIALSQGILKTEAEDIPVVQPAPTDAVPVAGN